MNPAREEILHRVRAGLRHGSNSAVPPIPETARFPARTPGDCKSELALFLGEAERLGCHTESLQSETDVARELATLVKAEGIRRATLWQTFELKQLGIEQALVSNGVEVVSPYSPNRQVAECELGITGADFALPETGTLVLRSRVEQPRTVSLLPRVHLAILRPTILRSDLHSVLEEIGQDDYAVWITGPSRTSDIELTTTVGVHGPKSLYIWVLP